MSRAMAWFFFLSVFGFSVWVSQRDSGLGRPGFDQTADGPDEACQFTGHGGDGHLGLLFAHAREVLVAVMQTALGLPGNVGDGFGQSFLALS
jgi:hypothetical protein